MKENKFFMRAEDEMDFIPIIPLNEQEGETGDGTDIPAEIPILVDIIISALRLICLSSSHVNMADE